MTVEPDYVIHAVDEKDVTIDWFFGEGHLATKVRQLVLVLVGWFFTLLPVVVTASALVHRDDQTTGWWGYHEGFAMWDRTMVLLGILLVMFVVGFLALHVLHRATLKERNRRATYDEERLALRLAIAERMYADRYGPEELRRELRTVPVQPYADIETYELRGLYRAQGVD